MPTRDEVSEAAEGTNGKPRQLFYKHLHYKDGSPKFDESRGVVVDYKTKKRSVPSHVVFLSGYMMRNVDEVWVNLGTNGNGDYWFEKE